MCVVAGTIGAVASGVGAVGSVVNGLTGGAGNGSPTSAGSAAATANPFGAYQPSFAQELAQQAGMGVNGQQTNYGLVDTGQLNAQQQYTSNSIANMGSLISPTTNYANQTANGGLTTALNGQQIGSQLSNLIANPSSIYQTPQYQAAFGQGQNAVNATLAAQGLNASGNQLAALQSYGQTFGQNAYNTDVSQLSGLYGQALGANQQGYNQLAGASQLGLAANQQGYNQLAQTTQSQQAVQQQAFNQMGQLSGLLSGSPVGAAQLMAQGNTNTANAVSSGISGLGSAATSLGNAFGIGTPSTTSGNNSYGFTTGATDPSYGVSYGF
jgi:hypothetical protein